MKNGNMLLLYSDLYSWDRQLQNDSSSLCELPFDLPGCHTQLRGKSIISFASNDYLSMSRDVGLIDVVNKAIIQYGTGAGSSMMGSGSLNIHHAFAENMADFFGKEACILLPTGFMAMMAFGAANLMNGAAIYSDDANHRSIIDGLMLGNSYIQDSTRHFSFFQHNSRASLETRLQKMKQDQADVLYDLVYTEGVFSTLGDLGNLVDMVDFCQKNNAVLAIDDAHGIGVLGHHGRGTADHLGVRDHVDFILGTFSKTFATTGGFILGPRNELNYLRLIASSYVYSASLPPANVAGAEYILNYLRQDDSRQERLWKNIDYFKRQLQDNQFDFGQSQSAVIPVFIRDAELTLLIARRLLSKGFFVVPFVPPAAASGQELLRFSINAGHTEDDIDAVIEAMTAIRNTLRQYHV